MPNKSEIYLYLYIYIFSMLVVVVEGYILGSLVDKKKIGYRPARRIAAFSAALTVFPGAWTVGWFSAVLLSAVFVYMTHHTWWFAEECRKKYPLNEKKETRN